MEDGNLRFPAIFIWMNGQIRRICTEIIHYSFFIIHLRFIGLRPINRNLKYSCSRILPQTSKNVNLLRKILFSWLNVHILFTTYGYNVREYFTERRLFRREAVPQAVFPRGAVQSGHRHPAGLAVFRSFLPVILLSAHRSDLQSHEPSGGGLHHWPPR